LFDHRAEYQPANAAEPVNCNFDCHNSISVFQFPIQTAHSIGGGFSVNEETDGKASLGENPNSKPQSATKSLSFSRRRLTADFTDFTDSE